MLAAIYANVIQRLRFWYACVNSVISLILYSLVVPRLTALPPDAVEGAVGMMAMALGCTLFANFELERDERRAYLVALQDDIRCRWLTRANAELHRISHLDALTGLANRRGLDQRHEALWTAAAEAGQPLCVLMLDVDFFKRFNDCYGHRAGDACLRQIAAAIGSQMRTSNDIVARFGGEEFLILLAGVDLLDGLRVGERIRHAVEACKIRHEAVPCGVVTVSIGGASATPMAATSAESLIATADAALYEAKKRGRNRVWPPVISACSDASGGHTIVA